MDFQSERQRTVNVKKCPCEKNKSHLGVFTIEPKETEITTELNKVQKEFYLGHGIKTNDSNKAADIFLDRDHQKLVSLLSEYFPGKLGVYMVPTTFYGEVPDVIKLSEFKGEKNVNRVKGDLAERALFHALKTHFALKGDDVIVIHSHKFLHKASNNEKDFIVLNLSNGSVMLVEVKSNQKGYQKAMKQMFDGKERIEEIFSALGITTEWKYVGIFYAHIGIDTPLFDCRHCSTFAIIGEDKIPNKLKKVEEEVRDKHEN